MAAQVENRATARGCKAVSKNASTSGDRSGRNRVTGSKMPPSSARNSSLAVGASNGMRPVRHSYATTAMDQRSSRGLGWSVPKACSGLM